jgi:hypothetical protein
VCEKQRSYTVVAIHFNCNGLSPRSHDYVDNLVASVTNKHSRDPLEEGRAVEGQPSHKDSKDKRLARGARVT